MIKNYKMLHASHAIEMLQPTELFYKFLFQLVLWFNFMCLFCCPYLVITILMLILFIAEVLPLILLADSILINNKDTNTGIAWYFNGNHMSVWKVFKTGPQQSGFRVLWYHWKIWIVKTLHLDDFNIRASSIKVFRCSLS